ncbi:hypothetical protein BKG82_26570 [Mycobacteroides chelonae]|uniref:Uncharacterized protein n=1 Tax=Mycobacteroides chelonae TaxID=1774 RepID=A0A1S1LIQ7_MYCCH|nr:hypothetical protein [Mycobacteroides chelonae]OHU47222.1 hypothetical protein BKG82_26570 [Mycobacteroides chelonae]
MSKPQRPWWFIATLAVLGIWLVGAHISQISNIWVSLNLIVPAGKPHLFTLPLAHPAVGVDLRTLTSLAGLAMIASAIATWISYLHRAPITSEPQEN